MRASIVIGLGSDTSLEATSPSWDKAVDEQVYSKEVRMVGAPAARRCTTCSKSFPCVECRGKKYVVGSNVYSLVKVLRLDQEDEDCAEHLRGAPGALLEATSVRRPRHTVLTPGYKAYEGCPHVFEGKRKASDSLLRDDAKRLGRGFKKEVTDPEVVKIVRAHLVRHSEKYAASRLSIRSDAKSIRVALSGEGARYCLNKGGFHTSQQVFMEIYKSVLVLVLGPR